MGDKNKGILVEEGRILSRKEYCDSMGFGDNTGLSEVKALRCRGCSKVVSEFAKRSDGKGTRHCSDCEPLYRIDNAIRSKYGITGIQYQGRLKKQNGRCAICNNAPTKKRLSVDHNHRTGRIRGLLCQGCNLAIGLLKEKEDNFISAMNYLKQDGDDVYLS